MDLSMSLNFIVPLIFALLILAGIATGARTPRDRHDRRER